MLANGLSYQDRNQATMVFCSKAPLSCPCWKPPFVQRQTTDGTTHHSWDGIKLMLCQDRVQGVWAGGIAYRYVERAARAPMNAGEAGPSVDRPGNLPANT